MPDFYLITIVLRLILACILGGIIGNEREHMNRPAGFRTHILVCIGSALVMITSEYLFRQYKGFTNMDPARLGAQVISGIGFLGAGTIIREGFNVKGLTTAASLWAVSCVGIAAGIGFYEGAITATILIYITLITLKKMEDRMLKKKVYSTIYIHSYNKSGQVSAVTGIFDNSKVAVKSIEFMNNENDKSLYMKIMLNMPDGLELRQVMEELHGLDGIQKVYEDQ